MLSVMEEGSKSIKAKKSTSEKLRVNKMQREGRGLSNNLIYDPRKNYLSQKPERVYKTLTSVKEEMLILLGRQKRTVRF